MESLPYLVYQLQAGNEARAPALTRVCQQTPSITEPEAFDLLITDRKPPADIAAMLNQHDIELLIAR